MVKLVDTPASGAGGGNPVEVQVLSWAPINEGRAKKALPFLFPPIRVLRPNRSRASMRFAVLVLPAHRPGH